VIGILSSIGQLDPLLSRSAGPKLTLLSGQQGRERMTCKVVLEVKAKPECVDDLLATLNEQLPATRAYEGCIEVYGYQDQDDPTTIMAIQEWESRAHYEKYFEWRVEQGDIETIRPMVAAPLSKRFFDKIA